MKLTDAVQIMHETYPGFNLISVVDYDDYYVFNVSPPGYDVARKGEWLGGLVAVDKMFRVPIHFIPLMHPGYAEAADNNITYF